MYLDGSDRRPESRILDQRQSTGQYRHSHAGPLIIRRSTTATGFGVVMQNGTHRGIKIRGHGPTVAPFSGRSEGSNRKLGRVRRLSNRRERDVRTLSGARARRRIDRRCNRNRELFAARRALLQADEGTGGLRFSTHTGKKGDHADDATAVEISRLSLSFKVLSKDNPKIEKHTQ